MGDVKWMQVVIEAVLVLAPMLTATYLGFKKMNWILGEYRPHTHIEEEGPLHVRGIRYPRTNGNRP